MFKLIAVQIDASGRHCNNDCHFMSNDAQRCLLFGKLTWNHKRAQNGNMRPSACRKTEQRAAKEM
jgi:hypothetical protein